MRVTIQERGNGLVDAGDYVSGDDGEVYRVVSTESSIFTGPPGSPNYIFAEVELADWNEIDDDNEPWCTAIIESDDDAAQS